MEVEEDKRVLVALVATMASLPPVLEEPVSPPAGRRDFLHEPEIPVNSTSAGGKASYSTWLTES